MTGYSLFAILVYLLLFFQKLSLSLERVRMEANLNTNPCNYCVNYDLSDDGDYKCLEGVPWYCVSIYCKFFCDGFPVFSPVRSKALNLNKILVNTF